jgi:hypothetical protein
VRPLRIRKSSSLLTKGTSQRARVDGGPVGERRRREPRAHRFQMVEGTQIIEQPSSFAGWRSVGGLQVPKRDGLPWVKGGAKSSDFEIHFERIGNNAADMPSGHSSLASDPTVVTLGVQRAKEEGTAARHSRMHSSQPRLPAPKKKRASAPSGRPLQPSLGPLTRMSFSPPQEGGAGLRNRSATRSSLLSHSRRKLAAREKLGRGKPPSGARISRSRTCPCVVMQLQKS